jgi:cobalt-zinc-cadmium efflux system outer membrane protein
LKTCFFISSLILGLVIPVAGYCETLSLGEAIQTALQNNPQVKSAKAKLAVSNAEIVTAGARLNPALVSDNGIAEKTYRLGIEQTLELGGKRKQRVALSQANQQVVLGEVNTLILDVRTNVRRAFTQLYNAQQRYQTFNEILSTTEKLLKVASLREKAGDIAKVDVLQSEVAVVNAKNDLQTVTYQVVQSRSTLNALLNQSLSADVELEAPPQQPSWVEAQPIPSQQNQPTVLQGRVGLVDTDLEQLIQMALTHRPEVFQNQQSILVTERQEALAKANRIPNLSLSAGPDWVREGDTALNVFVIGNVQLPVFNRQQGPLQEANAKRLQLQQEQQALKNQIGLEVTNAYTQFVASQERVNRYETELLPKAREVSEKSRRSFEVGKTSILIPMNAQQAFINTKLGYLQAMQDLQNAISDLERAVGAGL